MLKSDGVDAADSKAGAGVGAAATSGLPGAVVELSEQALSNEKLARRGSVSMDLRMGFDLFSSLLEISGISSLITWKTDVQVY